MKRLNRDLKDVIIIDNSPIAFHFDVNNGLPISSFTDNKNDKELFKLDFILESLAVVNDVRQFIPLIVHGQEINFLKAKDIFLVEKRHLNSNPINLQTQSFSNKEKEKELELSYENYFNNPPCTTNKDITDDKDKKHIKAKTISSILVKPYTADIENLTKLKESKENEQSSLTNSINTSKIIHSHNYSSIQANTSQKAIGTIKSITHSNSNTNYLKTEEKSRSKNKILYNKNKFEQGNLYNNSTKTTNSKQKTNSNTTNSKISLSDKKTNDKSKSNLSNANKFFKDFNYSHSIRAENSKTNDKSLNKTNVRDNSRSSIHSKNSKYSNKLYPLSNQGLKINKVSRNFKTDTPQSSKSKGKILKTNITSKTNLSNSTSKTKPFQNQSNKILGVKIFQVKTNYVAYKPNTAASSVKKTKDFNNTTTYNKYKYSPSVSKQYKNNSFSKDSKKSKEKRDMSFSKNLTHNFNTVSLTPSTNKRSSISKPSISYSLSKQTNTGFKSIGSNLKTHNINIIKVGDK